MKRWGARHLVWTLGVLWILILVGLAALSSPPRLSFDVFSVFLWVCWLFLLVVTGIVPGVIDDAAAAFLVAADKLGDVVRRARGLPRSVGPLLPKVRPPEPPLPGPVPPPPSVWAGPWSRPRLQLAGVLGTLLIIALGGVQILKLGWIGSAEFPPRTAMACVALAWLAGPTLCIVVLGWNRQGVWTTIIAFALVLLGAVARVPWKLWSQWMAMNKGLEAGPHYLMTTLGPLLLVYLVIGDRPRAATLLRMTGAQAVFVVSIGMVLTGFLGLTRAGVLRW